LRGIELMWCWFYGSKESPFDSYKKNKERAEVVSKYIFDKNENLHYEEKQKESLLKGSIPPNWYKCVDFFKNNITDMRVEAKNMMVAMYEEYQEIVTEGRHGFKNADDEIDYTKYVATMKRIKDEMPDLIDTIEKGYGTSLSLSKEDGNAELLIIYEGYIRNKR